jgi:hydroxymethylpyrimidine pyrophosphatase-like HAD family hydrolase
MKDVSHLKIEKDYISIFASGHSVLDIPKEDIKKIKEKSFVITMNYASSHFKEDEYDMLMFSDKKVSQWLKQAYKDRKKAALWVSRKQAFSGGNTRIPREIWNQLDYTFDNNKNGLKGNYTLPWLIQLINKHFPEKTILLFGVDMKAESKDNAKFYDKKIKWDREKRGKSYDINKKLNQCKEQLKKYCINKNIINCNLNSSLELYPKQDWKEILK